MQKTLKQIINFKGIGLHSGKEVNLTVNPAPENHGISFRRIDLPTQPEIKALYSNVIDTRNCTCLGDANGTQVSTIEHVMATFAVLGVDNAIVDVDGPEIPIMDGSGKPFYDLISQAELLEQKALRRKLKVLKSVSFTDDKGNHLTINPAQKGLKVKFDIEFPSKVVGHQVFEGEINQDVFASKIVFCRTFTELKAVEYLRSLGLIKGGSLDNAIVLDGDNIVNEEGFRIENECVNHKVMDAVGDLYSCGYRIIGELDAFHTGHFHANELLKKLFADRSNYELV